jgi:phosphatidylinositol glycan class V
MYSFSLLDVNAGKRVSGYVKLLLAAIPFSAATAVRNNGILSGALFAYDALLLLRRIVNQGVSRDVFVQLGVIIIGGCIVALGLIVPQLLAYAAFCMAEKPSRAWCDRLIPSNYGWVQVHY